MSFQNRKNLAQEIADHVSEKIIQMEIEPGERILEARIAQELNVSHSPVREAIRILERYRLVELSPRRGARVTDMSERHVGWMFDSCVVSGPPARKSAIPSSAATLMACVIQELPRIWLSTCLFDCGLFIVDFSPLKRQLS